MTRVTQHIARGVRDVSWCGLYIGWHDPKPSIIASDYTDRRAKGLTAPICRNCRRSFDAAEKAAAA